MFTRKRARQVAEKECVCTTNIPLKMSKTVKSARKSTDAAEETKTDLNNDTMNTSEGENVTRFIEPLDNDSIETIPNSGSLGDSSDEIISATDDLLREADILMAEIAEFRRENNSENDQDDDTVIVSESTDSPQVVSESDSSVETVATSVAASTSAQASTSANASTSASANTSHSNNAIDDSILLIDDSNSVATVRPIVRDDDEDVIFVTEKRPEIRTIATIDLCDTPDNSFSSTRSSKRGTDNPLAQVHTSPDMPDRNRIGMTKCPICLEMIPMNEILSTMCGHLYCDPCIRNVIKIRKKCPMCNRGLKPNQVHRIFFDS